MSATLLNPPFIMIWSSLHGQKSSSQDEIEYVELEKMAAACMLFIYLMPSGVWFGLVLFGLVAIWLQWVLLITPPTPSCHLLSVCTVTLTAECHLLRHLSPHINLQALNSTRTNNDLGSKWKSTFSRDISLLEQPDVSWIMINVHACFRLQLWNSSF